MSKKRKNCVYATIVLKMSQAGIHATCNDVGNDVFCVNGDIQPLVKLINEAEKLNPKRKIIEEEEE